MEEINKETTVIGGGCFWCLEAVYSKIAGVKSITSGYAGGQTKNPTYNDICTGETGHAEVIKLEYDPQMIHFEEILEWFWKCHDPTTLNRQGNDVGTQYRSVIYYMNQEQKELAIQSKKQADESGMYPDPVVTEITELPTFYSAENYHHDYYKNNPTVGYCSYVIAPKLAKLDLG